MGDSTLILTIVILAIVLSSSCGYPNGAPPEACSSLTPNHDGAVSNSAPSPFEITTDTASFEPGGKVTVRLSAISAVRIRGFIVQARLVGQGQPVGIFETIPRSAKHLFCPGDGSPLNTVTHTSSVQYLRLEFGWRVPLSLQGNIQFVVTIVASRYIFWTNVYSNVIIGTAAPPVQTAPPIPTAPPLPTFPNCPDTFTVPLEWNQNFALVDIDDALGGGTPPYVIIAGPLTSSPMRLEFNSALRVGVTVTVRISGSTDSSQDCSFLLALADTQAPNITCPDNQELQTATSDTAVFWAPALASDNVALRLSNPVIYSHVNGVRLPVSPSPVIITATAYDTSGNQATCDFRILVREQGNNNNNGPLMIGCPVDETVTFPLDAGTSHSTVDLDIQGRDANGQAVPVYRTAGPTDVVLPGVVEYSERFREGQRFTFEAVDPGTGTRSSCSFVVRLEDNESPEIFCPSAVRERTTQDSTTVSWPQALAIDNLISPRNITISYLPGNGSVFEANDPPKTSVITAEARDSFDNVAQCQFIVTLQKVEAECSPFPTLPRASAMCLTTSSDQAQCYVSCDPGYLYTMTSNLFICEVEPNGVAYWNPQPNDAMCAEPRNGERLFKSVTIRFIVPDVVCLRDDVELSLAVRNFIIPQLMGESLCEYNTARACEVEYIVPYCQGKPGLKRRRRRRQSPQTLLDVDIEVSAIVVNDSTEFSQITGHQQDVNILVSMIEQYVMRNQLRIRIDNEEHLSRTDWSIVSSSFAWICLHGWKTTSRGCVPCPYGSYQDTERNVCEFCPRSTYQDQSQQTSCLECLGEDIINREGIYTANGCYAVVPPTGGQGTSFTSLTAIFVIFCVILCLGLLFVIIAGIIYCCMRNKITHHFPSLRKRSVSKLQYLNQAFESDNETTTPGPEMPYDNNGAGTARRNVSRQFSRSSLSTQYGYSQEDADELALMNSNFSFGVRDDESGLVIGETGRSEHGGPDGGESTSSPGPVEEGGSLQQSPNSPEVESRNEKILDKSTGEYVWPAPPAPPSPPPPAPKREGVTVVEQHSPPTTRL